VAEKCIDCGESLQLGWDHKCEFPGRSATEVDVSALMVAAQKIIHARYGKQFKIEGCDPPTESEYWTFYVKDIRVSIPRGQAADPIITLHPDEMNEVARKTYPKDKSLAPRRSRKISVRRSSSSTRTDWTSCSTNEINRSVA
jgi:hypothetical protein